MMKESGAGQDIFSNPKILLFLIYLRLNESTFHEPLSLKAMASMPPDMKYRSPDGDSTNETALGSTVNIEFISSAGIILPEL